MRCQEAWGFGKLLCRYFLNTFSDHQIIDGNCRKIGHRTWRKLTLLMREGVSAGFLPVLKHTYTYRSSAHWDFTAYSSLFFLLEYYRARSRVAMLLRHLRSSGLRHRLLGKPEPVFTLVGEHHHCGLGRRGDA